MKLFIDADVIDALSALPALRRNRLYAHFRKIQNYPGNLSDYNELDDEGRLVVFPFLKE